MIETYKIISGKYDSEITPTLAMSDTRILNMTCVSFTLLTGLLTIGIICRIGLLQLIILNYLKKDLISIGNIILFMISERKFKELEVVVKFYEYYSIFYSTIHSFIHSFICIRQQGP